MVLSRSVYVGEDIVALMTPILYADIVSMNRWQSQVSHMNIDFIDKVLTDTLMTMGIDNVEDEDVPVADPQVDTEVEQGL